MSVEITFVDSRSIRWGRDNRCPHDGARYGYFDASCRLVALACAHCGDELPLPLEAGREPLGNLPAPGPSRSD